MADPMSVPAYASNPVLQSHPRVLFVDTSRRAVGARLAHTLSRLGCRVGIICPAQGHPSKSLSHRIDTFIYRPLQALQSLRDAILAFDPNVLIPVCDRAVELLHSLHAWAGEKGYRQIAACIERSLGPVESFPVVSSRHKLLALAAEEGIPVPAMIELRGVRDVQERRLEGRFPWVIKTDGSSGGQGVKIVEDAGSAQRFIALQLRRPRASTLLRRLCTSRDRAAVLAEWGRPPAAIMAQAWIAGRPANCSVVCSQGEVLAAISAEVIATSGPTGPATLIEIVEGHDMLKAATRIAARLRLTGFFGLDFMIESATGNTYLVEMNPRCTPSSSLEQAGGRNLAAAFYAHLAGQPQPLAQPLAMKKKIAVVPHASGDSGVPSEYDYDVPVDAPELARALLHPWRAHNWLGLWLIRMLGLKSSPHRAPVVSGRMAD